MAAGVAAGVAAGRLDGGGWDAEGCGGADGEGDGSDGDCATGDAVAATATDVAAADGDEPRPVSAGADPLDSRARARIANTATSTVPSTSWPPLRLRIEATAAGTREWSRTTGLVRTIDQRVTVSPPGRLSGDARAGERRSRGHGASGRAMLGAASTGRPAAARKVEQPACRSERQRRRCFSTVRSDGGATAPQRCSRDGDELRHTPSGTAR